MLYMSHCVFPCPELQTTAAYYQTVLGFKPVPYLSAKEPHICLYRDATEIILTDSGGRAVIPIGYSTVMGTTLISSPTGRRSCRRLSKRQGQRLYVRFPSPIITTPNLCSRISADAGSASAPSHDRVHIERLRNFL